MTRRNKPKSSKMEQNETIPDLKKLKRKREDIKQRFTRIQTFVDGFTPDQNINLIKAREKIARDAFNEFNQVQELIEDSVSVEQYSAETDEKIAFEELYFNTIAVIESILETYNNQKQTLINSNLNQTSVNPTQSIKVNLPIITIPEFNGALEKWLSFRDVFESLVHNNTRLSNVEKMHHLRSSLSGEALRCIESLSVSSANYNQAWELLKKRFENERLLIQAHIRKIMNSPAITKGTAASVRELSDVINTNLASLKVLKRPVDHWDDILVTIISDKLDQYSNREWQATLKNEMPSLENMKDFLEKRCQYLESLSHTAITKQTQQQATFKSPFKQTKSFSNNVVTKKILCHFCKRTNHSVNQCSAFLRLNVQDKLKQVDALKLCVNCLRDNHEIKSCKSINNCRFCKARHNTLLHINSENTPIADEVNLASTSSANYCEHQSSETLLSTALVLIKDDFNNYHKCRALLDGGSQSNFISRKLVTQLSLQPTKTNHNIIGINEKQSKINESVNVTIQSMHSKYTANLNCLVLNNITGHLPLNSFSITNLKIPKTIKLADNKFNESAPIDLLIGNEIFLSLLKHGKMQLHENHLYLQNSAFGWLIGGRINYDNSNTTSSINSLAVSSEDLNKLVDRFWQVEGYDEPCVANTLTKDESRAEKHFLETFTRDKDGRFIIKLPTKDDTIDLGDSYKIAVKRFLNLEKKFVSNIQFKSDYQNFIHEYIKLDHMEIVPPAESNNQNAYYIPHHAVYKNSDQSGKIRVVFDASTKSNNNKSLNQNLLIGPKIQQDLLPLLLRFRTWQYILSADIIKMYRQIKLDDKEKDYHRIIWRDNPDEPLKIYRLKTLTYGTACAPFLAVRCLQQLAYEYRATHPRASNAILQGFYVDDLLIGQNSSEELITLRNELIYILKSAGFELSKWASNESKCLPITEVSQAANDSQIINLDKDLERKTLGLYWNCHQDILKYKVDPITLPSKITKRNILASICKIFDPYGLVSPVIVKAKILLQQLWSRNLEWDQPVPKDIELAWTQLIQNLPKLSQIQIHRNVVSPNAKIIELHGFCDASEKAYGAAVYLRTVDEQNNSQIQLLIAKSRVAPLKTQSIPRLELLAAQLLSQLSNKISKTLNITIDKIHYWTDSTIVLAWLTQDSSHWQTFVANRVSEIQLNTKIEDWHHINSADNPADLVSRGVLPTQLINNNLWWHGPTWLKNSRENWHFSKSHSLTMDEIPEKRKVVFCNLSINQFEPGILTKISNFTKLQRIFAFVNRYIHNLKKRSNKLTGQLTTSELHKANNTIMALVQQKAFHQEYRNLLMKQPIHKNSKILSLDPFLDENGVIRVGGRLRNANMAYNKKHPIIVPKDHHITNIIIRHYHIRNLHSSAQATLAAIRQVYWPISGRTKVRQVLHKCVACFRAKPTLAQQKMGDLPVQRLEPARPFLNSGVDYCGPIQIKLSHGRGKIKTMKAYVCIFICLSTKAVHIELVSDLTSEAFLSSLKRFIARRGLIKTLISDNASNFVRSNKELKDLQIFFQHSDFQNQLITTLANDNISWSFIPPRAPNFGGIWEAAVKSAKYHLKRVIGETILTYEELYTLLTMIEACLNSRPLTPLSNDPNDLSVLTAGHFLIGDVLTTPLEHDLTELKVNRLSRWQMVQKMHQHFWRRWRLEYLSQLQGRNKWKSTTTSIQPGAMVIVVEENAPPLCWPLGRIQAVHPGKDGNVRVVTVKTNKGTYKRSISKVCVLPLEQ